MGLEVPSFKRVTGREPGVTCYVVATLDTRTLKVIDVGFYSEGADTLTYHSHDYHFLAVFEEDGEDYHNAVLNAIERILRGGWHYEWLKPWALREKKKFDDTIGVVVTGKKVR
jgi:hypothetical protein